MRATFENSLPGTPDWKCFLESAETLLQKESLCEQSALLTQTITDFFHVNSKFWFAHPLYPLPGEETPEIINSKVDLDHTIEIDPDSILILYTDGVTDTVSPGGENYSLKRLTHLISNSRYENQKILRAPLKMILFNSGLEYRAWMILLFWFHTGYNLLLEKF